MSIAELKNLKVSFEMEGKGFGTREIQVIKGLDLKLEKGEVLSIVGASGSGKSMLAATMFDILPQNAKVSGTMYYHMDETKDYIEKGIYIPQSASFLDPLIKMGRQIKLSENGLADKTKELYPFQCSGGMIRNAFLDLIYDREEADLIVADEPTPGMDDELALSTLKVLRGLADRGKAVLMITHDIDLAIQVSDKIAVFYEGEIVDVAVVEELIKGEFKHPYTKALYEALPQNEFMGES